MGWKERFAAVEQEEQQAQDPSAPRQSGPQPPSTAVQDVLRSLPEHAAAATLNGLQVPTFGYADEAMTAMGGPFAQAEQFRSQHREQYPVAGAVAEAGFGMIPALKGASMVGNLTQQIDNPLLRLGANAGSLFGAGSLYGSGVAEEGERMGSAAVGGALNTLLGGAGWATGRLGGAVVDPAMNWAGKFFRSADDQAAHLTGVERAKRGAPTDEDAIPPVAGGSKGPLAIAADYDPVATAQLKAVYDQFPDSRQQIERLLETRQLGSSQRVMDDLENITGLPRDFRRQVEATLDASRKRFADKGYKELYEGRVPISDDLLDMFTGPEGKTLEKAYKSAYQTAAEQGDPIKSFDSVFGDAGDLSDISPKAIDYMQRELRRMGQQGAIFKTANMGKESLRQRLLTATDDAMPTFRNLREEYATRIRLDEALSEGKKLYSLGDARDVADYVSTLSHMEQGAFRRGAMDAVESRVRNARVKSGNMETKMAGSIQDNELLEVAFKGKTDDVLATLGREDMFNNTYKEVLGGSSTSKNLGSGKFFESNYSGKGVGEVVTEQVAKTVSKAVGDVHPTVIQAMTKQLLSKGYTPDQAARIARSGDPEAIIAQYGLVGMTGAGLGAASQAPTIHKGRLM